MQDKKLIPAKRLSHLLDNAFLIPGTNIRVGLDPILGLIPGVGDVVSSLLSSYIIILALQLGVSRWTVARMLFNVLLDASLGSLPFIGDIFDAFWKANQRNLNLLETAAIDSKRKGVDRTFLIMIITALLGIFVLGLWLSWQVVQWIIHFF